MAPWSLHEMFPSLDIKDIPGYPNNFSLYSRYNCQNFDRSPSLIVTHVVNLFKYTSEIDAMHQYVLIRLFFLSLDIRQNN